MTLTPPAFGVRNGSLKIRERTQMLLQFDCADECNAINWLADAQLQQVGELLQNETGIVAIAQVSCGEPDLPTRTIRATGCSNFDDIFLTHDDADSEMITTSFIILIEDGTITPLFNAKPLDYSVGKLEEGDRQLLAEFVGDAFTSVNIKGKILKTNHCGDCYIEIEASW
jgi:hypothetical protein